MAQELAIGSCCDARKDGKYLNMFLCLDERIRKTHNVYTRCACNKVHEYRRRLLLRVEHQASYVVPQQFPFYNLATCLRRDCSINHVLSTTCHQQDRQWSRLVKVKLQRVLLPVLDAQLTAHGQLGHERQYHHRHVPAAGSNQNHHLLFLVVAVDGSL